MRLLLALASGMLAAQDPRALVEKSFAREQREDEIARQYAYLETTAEQEWRDGRRTRLQLETYEIISLYGQPYRRLVAKDGKPLPLADQKKEQAKIDKLSADRSKESSAERERRIAKAVEQRRRQRAFIQAVPKAYSFQLIGETTVDNRAAWMIDATPLTTFQPKDARERMLTKFKGRFFIAKSDEALLKVQAEAIDTVSFGLMLARLDKGARFTLEKTLVNNELWMPSRIKVDFDAWLAFFKKIRMDLQIDYSDFRKFQSESKVVSVGPVDN